MKRPLLILLLIAATMSAATPPKEVFLIDFFTQRGDVSPHGTLSLIDGIPKSTWTVQTGQNKKTYDTKITEEQFRSIWDKLSDLSELNGYVSTDPKERISFTDRYVVGISYLLSGKQGQRLYLIPHDCKSKEVLAWALEIEAFSKEGS